MRFKGTYVLLLIFLVLGGYVYFADYRGRDERQQEEERKKRVFAVEEKDIAEIRLEYPDRTIAAVRKGEDSWEMTLPPGMEADSQEWNSLASNLARVEKEEAVAGENPDLSLFGLDKPAVKVTAKVQGAAPREIGVLFGLPNPRKTFHYAKLLDSNEVFLAATSWSGLFTKSVADLRNKEIMDFESESVDSMKIAVTGRPEIEFQKSGNDWLMKKPVDTRAESGEVSSFISAIQFARATDFAEASVDALKAGLDPPQVRVTLHDQKAGVDRVLLVGKASGTDMYYVKDQARPVIFVVGKDIPDKLRRPVFDWRDKSIAQFNRDAVDEIQILRGAEKLVARKMGADWTWADGRKLQSGKISEILSNAEFERALAILDSPSALSAYGLNPGRLTLIFREAGKEVLNVVIGAESRNPEGVYAKVASSPAVLTLSKTLYDTVNVKEGDLTETPPAAEPASK